MLFTTSLFLYALSAYGSHVRADPTSTSTASGTLASCQAAMDGVLPAPTPSGFFYSGNVRKYYVAAEEM